MNFINIINGAISTAQRYNKKWNLSSIINGKATVKLRNDRTKYTEPTTNKPKYMKKSLMSEGT